MYCFTEKEIENLSSEKQYYSRCISIHPSMILFILTRKKLRAKVLLNTKK